MGFFWDEWFTVKTQNEVMNEFMQNITNTYSPQTTLTYQPNIQPSTTLTPTIQYNPQFLINSAGASATGGNANPTIIPSQTITPTTTISPVNTTTPTVSPTQTASQSQAQGGGIDWMTLAIIAGVGVLAYVLLTNKQAKKNVRSGYKKAKRTGKKAVKYGAKYGKYVAMAV